MMRSLYSAATGMIAQQTHLDVIAHNLANVNTTGFKKNRAEFQDLIYQTHKFAGTETIGGQQIPVGVQVGLGTKVNTTAKIHTQGDYVKTDSPLDVAIEGEGYFRVIRNGELFYTRDGAFKLNSDGVIVSQDGNPLDPEFMVPAEAVHIEIDNFGFITALDDRQEILAEGRILLSRFVNPPGLFAMGYNIYEPTAASGPPIDGNPGEESFGGIAHGFLELSNVEVVMEMVEMITAQRAYEMNSKAITTSDEMLAIANNLKR
ncbi:MAG: flagellar basal-body rod protein FlgG [Deltaproteobacteria bacterium]|jgi:flagellar basal-body rod protein FlgG|nr:flagellar basal-body rod protein FlgG [Deltaproteobacteria bacterium]